MGKRDCRIRGQTDRRKELKWQDTKKYERDIERHINVWKSARNIKKKRQINEKWYLGQTR